ncbi:hypothetical protein NM688_g6628 [Phlebia brevispora]|uniref:Uncharacterized protein n=1 Tax=Phlebia brevispora TaxID=194682 RepID=A0ACC1SDZ4_9APHY|nr:hypothetical protein NM688_g6628 [Phlebia brevispora]
MDDAEEAAATAKLRARERWQNCLIVEEPKSNYPLRVRPIFHSWRAEYRARDHSSNRHESKGLQAKTAP